MLKKVLLTAAFVAFGASTALACSYQKNVHTPVPPVASAPDQTPAPTEEKVVVETDERKDDVKPN
jgi:hypothetical protein